MFKIVSAPTFKATVKVLVPGAEQADTWSTETFEATFSAIGIDEARAITEKLAALPAEEVPAHEHDTLRRVLVGWNDVADESGAPVPFTPDNLNAALQFPWFPTAVLAAYRAAVFGEKARLGN